MTYPQPKPGVGLKTICVDLDGMLAEPTWPSPKIGAPIQVAVDAAIAARNDGWEMVILTARPESHKTEIKLWLLDHGLSDVFYDVICGKPRAAAYWDDRAVTFPEAFMRGPRTMRGGRTSMPDHPENKECKHFGCEPVR